MNESAHTMNYASFWRRFVANAVDGFIVSAIRTFLVLIYQLLQIRDVDVWIITGYLFSFVAMPAYVIVFWYKYQATPGKMLLKVKIVDENGNPPTLVQYATRYIGYILSGIPFGLGFLWIAFDKKKQGWHDKIAKTYVIRTY